MRPKPILFNPSLDFIAHVTSFISVCYSQPPTSSFLRICKMLSQSLMAKHGILPFLLSLHNKFGHALRREAWNFRQFRKKIARESYKFLSTPSSSMFPPHQSRLTTSYTFFKTFIFVSDVLLKHRLPPSSGLHLPVI